MKDMEGKPMESKPSMGEGLSMDEMMEKAMVAAEQKIQAKMDEAMAKRLNAEAPQQLNVNIMQPPQLNNNNNNNSMQMQAPMPQQMYTHESRAKWHSGLLDPFNDMSICFGVCCCFPCAYGMLVDMNMYNKAEGKGPCGKVSACCSACCVPVVFIPCVTSGNRSWIRSKFNLKAEPCDDLCVHCCCLCCAVCQECRELKYRHGGYPGRH